MAKEIIYGAEARSALQRGVDTFLLLGDFVAELPYPQKTMERLYALKEKYECIFIRGNKEDYWIEHQRNGNSKSKLWNV